MREKDGYMAKAVQSARRKANAPPDWVVKAAEDMARSPRARKILDELDKL